MGLMPLNVFSIAGEALNFGWRRFETILRAGWLPLTLILVFNMASVFLWLSLAYGEAITFTDVAASGARWPQVIALAQQKAAEQAGAGPALALQAGSLIVTAMLVASFMAPLIRYAGLGERPARGLLRAPFGPDQIRFLAAGALSSVVFALAVYAPVTMMTTAVLGFMGTAMTTPYATFPDADSLHTAQIILGADRFGVRWLYGWQVWSLAAAAFAALLISVVFGHVAPRAEDRKAGIGPLGRGLGTVLAFAAFFGAAAWLYAQAPGVAALDATAKADGLSGVLFAVAAGAFAAFVGLRLFPYAGVAVCRRSMAIAGSLRVTRRFNLFRLLAVFGLLAAVLAGAQLLLVFLTGQVGAALTGVIAAAQGAARLEGGDANDALRAGIWLWAAGGVVANALWTLFTYGVTAGLMGRLYRESERV
ncbi:MAG TPA: hypothetical protein DDZ68_16830 [Parvularcula sp.]|nr:hypothetical protein [Parvularcula sp.]HBS32538.1 hypothetical protein [Parvularcula sp.]